MTTPQAVHPCHSSHQLIAADEPSGTKVPFGDNASGTPNGGDNRRQQSHDVSGERPVAEGDGRLASQTNQAGTLLATFTYDPSGIPESVVVGTDPVNGPRYYYVYNGHGDVVALTDASGTVVASYSYDVWGTLTSSSENIPNANGWTNPYRYDGKDGARYDVETGLYWLSTRAYDPTLGRFLQRDPLGRMPLYFPFQPYVYAGNNPLVNVDPTGELITRWGGGNLSAAEQGQAARMVQHFARIQTQRAANQCSATCQEQQRRQWIAEVKLSAESRAKNDAQAAADLLQIVGNVLTVLTGLLTVFAVALTVIALFQPEAAVAAARLDILAASMWIVLNQVNAYQQLFAREASNDVSWFTPANINTYLDGKNKILAFEGGGLEVSLLGTLLGVVGKWGAVATQAGLTVFQVVKGVNLVAAAITTIANVGLYVYTSDQMEQQMADACPSSLSQAGGC